MARDAKDNVILGAVRGYEFEAVRPFLASLQRTGFEGAVALYASAITEATAEALCAHGVQLLRLDDDHPLHALPVNSARYFVYDSFLAEHGDAFAHAFLTDVRDVYFQRDPFAFDIGDALCCFLEDPSKTLGTCEYNSGWLKTVYGQAVLDELGDRPISCSGTTIGAVPAVRQYLGLMVEYLLRLNEDHPALSRVLAPLDQAVHNYVLNKAAPPNLRLIENDHGPVLSLVYKAPATIRFDEAGRALNDDGEVVHVLHQYDRHEELAAALLKKL